ncbi:hypothetical protein Y032_0069g392 [Ancylostoma ceylanicum]|uniref:Uncharacterized protein n=1 Tax=Ancylostoma ceylanicum TaxID=53326 RepID=A0A016TXJ9_9BILA|nr:hypothetical protein Y032_0069g392 [Ancylostoma ceylanicum]
MTIPVRYINRHKSDESPVLERVEVAKIWSWEVDRSKLCWLPATPVTLVNESWRVRSIRSTTSHVNSGQQTVTGPLLENGIKDHFETICVYRWNQCAEWMLNLLLPQPRKRGGPLPLRVAPLFYSFIGRGNWRDVMERKYICTGASAQ